MSSLIYRPTARGDLPATCKKISIRCNELRDTPCITPERFEITSDCFHQDSIIVTRSGEAEGGDCYIYLANFIGTTEEGGLDRFLINVFWQRNLWKMVIDTATCFDTVLFGDSTNPMNPAGIYKERGGNLSFATATLLSER